MTFLVFEERLVRNGTLYLSLAMCGMEIQRGKVFLTLGYLLITEKGIWAVELLSGKHDHSSFKGIELGCLPCPVVLIQRMGKWLSRPFHQVRSALSLKLLS